MPKFYGQNKKRIDPRYFLNEVLEEEGMRPPWVDPNKPEEKPQNRAHALAMQGLKNASDASMKTQTTLGVLDGALEDGTPVIDVLNDVRAALDGSGQQSVLEVFDQFLSELGIDLGGPTTSGY